jgi:anti-anti-sigma factor
VSCSSTPDVSERRVRLALSGDLDLLTRDTVWHTVVHSLRSRPSHIALDLSAVTFIDCAGLSGVLRAQGLAHQRNCELAIVDMSAATRRLLAMTDSLIQLTAGHQSCDDRGHQ